MLASLVLSGLLSRIFQVRGTPSEGKNEVPPLRERFTFPWTLGILFFLSSVLPPNNSPLIPARERDWIPYVVLIAGLVSPFGNRLIQSGVALGFSLLAAWLVVPPYPDLFPSRSLSIPILAGGLWLLGECLVERKPGPLMVGMMSFSAFLLGAITLVFSSFSDAQRILPASSILLGLILINPISARLKSASHPAVRPGRGGAYVYSFALLSWGYVAAVYPKEPYWGYVIIPWIPIGLQIPFLFGGANCRTRLGIRLALCGTITIIAILLVLRRGQVI